MAHVQVCRVCFAGNRYGHWNRGVKRIHIASSDNIPHGQAGALPAHDDWIVVGKLGPQRQQVVAATRHALLERLERARELPLSVITAPAGFGKSTLLAQWHQRLLASRRAHAAWLTLDEDDGEISRFVAWLALAVHAAGIDIGPLLHTARAQWHDIDARSATAALIGHIRAAPLPLVLILDDCERMGSPEVDALLGKLIEYADPRLHVVLSGRERPSLPLSGFIARGMADCMDASDMALSLDEATHLFGDQLAPELLRQIHAQTEGWAVALQLAALWVDSGMAADGDNLLRGFSSSPSGIASWLTEQVLERLDMDLRDFMLRTSILSRFDAALADVVLECTGSARQLARLEAFRGLLIPLQGAAEPTFRWHHLLAEYLQSQLQRQFPECVPGLHQRAAIRLNASGDLLEAVRHALRAGDQCLAVRFIADAGGWGLVLDKGLGYVRPLLRQFAPEHLHNDPVLTVTQAYLEIKLGEFAKAQQLLERYQHFPAPQQSAYLDGYITVRSLLDDYLDTFWNDPQRVDDIRTHLEAMPEHSLASATLRCMCAVGESRRGDFTAALEHAKIALTGMRHVGNVIGIGYALFHLGQNHVHLGQLNQAEAVYQQALQVADAYFGVDSTLKGYGQCLLAQIHYWRGDLAQARTRLDRGLPLLDPRDGRLDVFVSALETRVALTRTQQGAQAALVLLDQHEQDAHALGLPRLHALIRAWRLDALLDLEDSRKAEQAIVLGTWDTRFESALQHPRHWREQTALGLALAHWHARGGRSGTAVGILQHLERACIQGARELHLAQTRAHLALLLQQRGEIALALDTLGPALDYVAAQQAWQALLMLGQPAQSLLHLARQRDPLAYRGSSRYQVLQHALKSLQGHHTPLDGFSPREQAVLAQMCHGHTNKHIARALNLSENTVKFHLKNIFRKLGVTTRSAAVAALHAREVSGSSIELP